jgi:hypothetical protein
MKVFDQRLLVFFLRGIVPGDGAAAAYLHPVIRQ